MPVSSPSLLEEKLVALEKARTWSPRVIAKLEALLATEDPWALYRVNPLRFAAERGVDEDEAVDLFLHASKLGLFRMEWRLLCPSCSDTVTSFLSLTTLHNHCYCTLCHMETEAQLDDYIRVSFNASQELRDLPFHHPESLGVDDYVFRYRLDPKALAPDGKHLEVDLMRSIAKAAGVLAPGATDSAEFEVLKGMLVGHDFESGQGFMAALDPQGAESLDLTLDQQGFHGAATVKPGRVKAALRNLQGRRAAWALVNLPEDYKPGIVTLEPGLSGNRLLNSQTFRTLYRNETLGGSEGIGVRDLALLFTDLKGSTAMYERIGDLKAFALVQQHFEHLTRSIQAHHGAVVKTIGDAVMASFNNAGDAVAAALDMLGEIEAFNQSQGHREILLKVGVHRGPSIAVTLNERLDYFGQTVNIAARVQGLAGAEEICLTEAVWSAPEVAGLLQGLRVQKEEASVKGVSGRLGIRRVALGKGKAKAAAKPKAKAKASSKARAKSKPKRTVSKAKARGGTPARSKSKSKSKTKAPAKSQRSGRPGVKTS